MSTEDPQPSDGDELRSPVADPDLPPLWNRSEALALGALIGVVSLIQLIWILRDNAALPPSDTYNFLTLLLRFIDGGVDSLTDLWNSVGKLSHHGRPPLYQLLTAPFLLIFGRSTDSALFVNFVFLTLLMVSTWGLGRAAKDSSAGLLAAFLIACYPPIIYLSRSYVPHFASVACGAFSLWLLTLLIETRSAKIAWLFGGSLALGLWIHPNFIYLLAVPTLLAGFYLLLFHRSPHFPASLKEAPAWLWGKVSDRFILRGLLPAALLPIALALPWYLTVGQKLLGVRSRIQAADISSFRGRSVITIGFPEIEPTFWWFARSAPHTLTYFFAGLVAVSLVFAMIRRHPVRWLLLLALVATYSRLSLSTSRRWVAISLVLPIAAALTATFVTSLKPRWLSRGALALCVIVGSFCFAVVTWGAGPRIEPVVAALGAPLQTSCKWPSVPAFCPRPAVLSEDSWPIDEIADTLLEDPICQRKNPCRLMLVRTQEMWSNKLHYYLLERHADLNVVVTTVGVSTWGHGYQSSSLLRSDFYLFPQESRKGSRSGDTTDYRQATLRFLQEPPEVFADSVEQVATFAIPRQKQAYLLKRVRRLNKKEAGLALASLELKDKNKLGNFSKRSAQQGAAEKGADIHLERARALIAKGNATEAIAELEQAITVAPNDSRPRIELGRVYRTLKDDERAASSYQEALEIQPNLLSARMELAAIYRRTGRTEAAIGELERAIELVPDDPAPRNRLAELYRKLRQDEEALRSYREVLEIQPDNVAARIGLASIYTRQGETDKAIAELEQAIELAPDEPWPRNRLAEIYRSQGDNDRAFRWYSEALEIQPDDLTARIGRASIYKRRGETASAVAELEQAIVAAPDNPWPRRTLADLYRSLGQTANARRLYQELLALDPQDSRARKALAKMGG